MPKNLNCRKGQSAVELAIFGSILIFVISLIFRQGLTGGNFMRVQMQATRYAMSKSLEMTLSQKPGRNNASVLVIEDRLSGDFANKFGSRDRVPLIASGSASFSNQFFYPIDAQDFNDLDVLPHMDMWINGQRFFFLTSGFRTIVLPATQGNLKTCNQPHPNDSRCWDPACHTNDPQDPGCVILRKVVQNYPGSGYNASVSGNFDLNFTGVDIVAAAGVPKTEIANNNGKMAFMWQWQFVPALGELPESELMDVDGDFYEEKIINSSVANSGRTLAVNVIDSQAGDLDFTIDDRRPNVEVGLLKESRMYSFTEHGTYYQIKEGKLLGANGQFIRNVNRSDQVDVVERIIQLSNDTGRFCLNNVPSNGAMACGNCFSPNNVKLTCFDPNTLRFYVRNNIINKAGRNWFTRTEP